MIVCENDLLPYCLEFAKQIAITDRSTYQGLKKGTNASVIALLKDETPFLSNRKAKL